MGGAIPSRELQLFITHCLTERGLAESTIRIYRMDLDPLEAFLAGRGVTLMTASAEQFGAYIASLALAGRASASVRRVADLIRNFLKYAKEIGPNRDAIREQIDPPKMEHRLPVVLNRFDTDKLLRMPAKYDKTYLRDVAVLETLYACGLRISELCGMRLGDVNQAERHIRVLGKGSKERLIPLGKVAGAALAKYVTEWRPRFDKGHTEGYLFITIFGKPMHDGTVSKLVEECRDRANIGAKITPHTLRHCFATHLVGGGANLRVVQELLGHSNLNTTEKYVHLDPTRLKAVHQKFHPRG